MSRPQCPSTKVTPCLTPSFWLGVIVQNSTMISLSGGTLFSATVEMEIAIDKEKTYDLPDGNCITVGAGMSFQPDPRRLK